ncbi:hypothetical protein LPL9_0845 [Lacticaseibacillus paracasei]|nr:hypothetical protein LPL9_0845 [Lacticaseibacillus paracasei]EEI67948.1 hypothetical protein HMPREF0530_1768 [Lacticaseibacillus paracasei subsp. paracasei ATCC 25302 = DSM 5622 = JCM 8130]EPC34708.1 hypothetical protein Lpp120_0751 [Lacticaseibacillus paracasei subsp. paracasei Lpp120]OUC72775.1 hypothetical protein BWK52_0927c [Lacticaseibacillus paracasei]QHV92649.1 hypothetical protein EOK76_g2258 [Lacticaseibacillus paracasei]
MIATQLNLSVLPANIKWGSYARQFKTGPALTPFLGCWQFTLRS